MRAPGRDAPVELPPGAYLRLVVRDEGTGMDEATLRRATEPFFTTKGAGRGSGLGLPMVQGFAQQSGGTLRLRSRPGEGTEAEVWLPASAEAATAPAGTTLVTPVPAGRPRRVLLVDDDGLVLAGTAAMLEDLGHVVVTARSGPEALALLDRDMAVQAVVTDHAMPGMTGLDLAREIRLRRPDLPVVLATGYAELPAAATAGLPRLNKPYRQQELAEVLATLRDEVA
jgi:CheY-like chemotaxis protein